MNTVEDFVEKKLVATEVDLKHENEGPITSNSIEMVTLNSIDMKFSTDPNPELTLSKSVEMSLAKSGDKEMVGMSISSSSYEMGLLSSLDLPTSVSVDMMGLSNSVEMGIANSDVLETANSIVSETPTTASSLVRMVRNVMTPVDFTIGESFTTSSNNDDVPEAEINHVVKTLNVADEHVSPVAKYNDKVVSNQAPKGLESMYPPDNPSSFEVDNAPYMLEQGIFMDYQRRVQERFDLINSFCDTTFEPLTFNSPRKRWLTKPGDYFDYLDYVVCYKTKGNPELLYPDHWHYVTFGFSDIHGLNWTPKFDEDGKSGLGFELSLRVTSYPAEITPPEWPVEFLQRFATYIFLNGTHVEAGDFFMWGTCLDFSRIDSPIRHILIGKDISFPLLNTPTGELKIHQVVGVTKEEIEIAQNWKGLSFLELFAQREKMGGRALVTDIDRQQSLFSYYPEFHSIVRQRVAKEGSDLSGVSARILWSDKPEIMFRGNKVNLLSRKERQAYAKKNPCSKAATSEIDSKRCFQMNIDDITNLLCETTLKEREADCTNGENIENTNVPVQEGRPRPLLSVHLTMDTEALMMLPLAFRGRINHKRHFTFKSYNSDDAITFVPAEMQGSFATRSLPYAAEKRWLHIYLNKVTRDEIIKNISDLVSNGQQNPFPKLLCYDQYQIAISVLNPEQPIFY